MYPITEAVKALFEAEQRKVLRITGTDKNGAVISITDNDVIADSFQVDRYSCNGEKLEVGTAIAAQMTLTLENSGGQYNGIVFEGAELFVEVGIADWTQSSPTITYVPCGYFTPDEQPRRLSTISITGLDRMTKFDVVVDAADLTFPTTVAGLVGQVCTLCGVTLAQSISGLVNASVAVTDMPTAQGEITYRNLIQWCAGIMGTNAWFDWNGQLRFSWYANATGYVSTADNRYSSDLYEDDLTVSGVEYTNDSGIVIVEGTDDYAIDLTGNAIVGPLVATVLPPLNTALNGFTYRPFTAATVNAPYLWPMDVVTFTDRDGNNHTSALTNVAFGLNGTTAMESKGMTYAINKLAQPKGFTREQAQLVNQAMEHVEQDIDESLTQQEIFNRLTDNGAAQGLVLYNGQLYVNASYIYSGLLTLGGLNNENGTMRVLDADGNVVGTWTKDGIAINAGSLQLMAESGTEKVKVSIKENLSEPFKVSYEGANIDADTNFDGRTIELSDNNSGAKLYISPSEISASESNTVWMDIAKYSSGIASLRLVSDDGDISLAPDLFYIAYKGNRVFYISYNNGNPALYFDGSLSVGDAASTRSNLGITPENIGAFKQIPGYVTRAMLDDYNIKYWYGGRVLASDALAIGLPSHEWFVLNMSKDDDTDSSWTRQVFYQLDGSMIFERTCSYHTWNPVTKVSIIDDYGHAATIKQEVIDSARSFILHSCGNVYPDVGAIFKETGLQLWDYNNVSQLWWFPKEIGSAPPVSLHQHDGSREIVLAEISKVVPGYTAPIFITGNGCSHLTGGKLSLYLSGTIARSSPTSVVIMAAELSPATAIYTWRVDNLLDPNNWKFGAITKYAGAVI